ncbi:MAG: HD domain-containing protein [bacterium]
MIYTPMTKKAMKLMCKAHRNQLDKTGLPYILHPWHVAEMMKDEKTTIIALLHDVVEDTGYSLEDIQSLGFDEDIIEALSLMTHDPRESYEAYIQRLGSNPLARVVKMADLSHNMQIERLDAITPYVQKRQKKYQSAYQYLLDLTKMMD